MVRRIETSWSYRQSILLLGLLALAAWNHRTALVDIALIGLHNEEQSHILLAPIIALWLAWLRRSRLHLLPTAPSLFGPLIIAAAWVLSWQSERVDFQLGWHASVLLSGMGCLVTVAGFDVIRRFAPAFMALVFLVPVPQSILIAIAIPLQNMATSVTQSMLEMLGVPSVRSGHTLMIQGNAVAVGEACNGMRMVFALFLTVYAFAFSIPLRQSVRVLLLALSPVTALSCNVVRLVPTSIMFAYSSPEQAERFHDLSGWIMLPIALFLLVGVIRLIRWIEVPVMSFRLAMR